MSRLVAGTRISGDIAEPAEAYVVPLTQVSAARSVRSDAVILAFVKSPLTSAFSSASSVLEQLRRDPEAGHAALGNWANASKGEAAEAVEAGADGIAYILAGAEPRTMSPMEYGGYFLELDRAILGCNRQPNNVLLILGEHEPYLDFVSDLPAGAFAWEAASGVSVSSVRQMRPGLLATDLDEADIRLLPSALAAAKSAFSTAVPA